MSDHPRTIECPVHRHARRFPERIALRGDEGSLTYRELESRIVERARILRSSGVAEGDRVAIIAANSIESATWIFTLYRAGVTALPLNLRQTLGWWKSALELAGCRLVIADPDYRDRVEELGFPVYPILPVPGRTGPASAAANGMDRVSPDIRSDLEATICFTSGSTGRPRGVVLSFGSHIASALGSIANLPLTRGDRWLAVLPFYHVGGMAILFRSALAGSTVIVQSPFDPGRINLMIDRSEISHISLVPTMLERLIEDRDSRPFPGSLSSILLGGGQVPGRLLDTIDALSIPALTTYGMTETASQVATRSFDDPADKRRSSGKPLHHCEVGIVDERGFPVERGVTGEIRVRGDSLFEGYLGEESRRPIDSEGWFRTGDVGMLDGDGYLYVTGRLDDMFISGGENIQPWVITHEATEVPGVIDCAVVPVEDPKWGRRPVLFVRLRREVFPGKEALSAHLERRLPPIMVPDRIVEVEEIPRNALGKIDRAALLILLDAGQRPA